ncbi:MAG: phosphoribosyltransferase [Bacteroidetes bacterium]|nr:phosphoribosyltransferase [Bacteroidota bacterium]HNR20301.1 phosphoribosyltransferase family protein [Bacteroidia bacterium]HNU33929.1 phosphoribosyltransferase family protein [Bacteroidia bacterium]
MDKTLILNDKQIKHRIERIAYQIFEDNHTEKEIIIAGIAKTGYVFAQKIEKALNKISSAKTILIKITVDKDKPLHTTIEDGFSEKTLKNKVVILADDVLNSGKTMIYAMRTFLNADVKKIRTVLLVDRDHKRYPIAADYVGLTLSTTLREHISVEFSSKGNAVYLQ